ncbi:hypothetical protein O181_029593 [Austropuccinia psidii MF-1]|uniref:Uncharacterized protein n=1 Tax=Austropuccinia psidii MF-1 TaxID=1389203 RepID=A0A9Q3H2W3_9BASI|nr:hypothetical protein [Austropuccinia psidii MF-1]
MYYTVKNSYSIGKETVEDSFIPLESQSQATISVTPSEPEGSKVKGTRHSEGLIKAKNWTPIATQKSRKPRNSASIQGKPTLTACTGKITLINPVVTSKGKFPKSADNKFVQGTVKETLASKGTKRTEKAFPEPEDLEADNLDTVVDGKTMRERISTFPFTLHFNRDFKPEHWKHMDQVLQLHQLLKDLFEWSMDNKISNLATHWVELGAIQTPGGKGNQDKGESSHYPSYRRTTDPDRAYSDSFRLTRSRPNQLSSGFTLFRNQQISGQESPFFTIPEGFQEKTRKQGQKQDLLQPEEERVRPHDPEAVGFGERSSQEPEVAVNNFRISSPINRNITPTQIENDVVTPESNSNSDALWLQMSQYAEQTQKQFAELEGSHESMKQLTSSMDKIVKALQEGQAQLSKASEETNKRLNLVFEEQHHRRRDRDCLDKDINKLFNVYHSMKPQPQGHVMDNPYNQDDIKPDAMLVNKARSPSQYQDGDNMSYLGKETLRQLPEASSWPKFSVTGEYDHMELIDYIDGLFIDVPCILDYWISAILNTPFKGHASIWYTEMREINGRRHWALWKSQIIQRYSNGTWIWQKTRSFENDKYSFDKDPYEWCLRKDRRVKATGPQMNTQMRNHKLLTQMPEELEHSVKCTCNHNCTLDDIANTLQDVRKRTNIAKFTPYRSSSFKEKQPFMVEFKDKPKERVAEVTKKKNYCHNCGSTDHYANNWRCHQRTI